jgi:hypothetical protein
MDEQGQSFGTERSPSTTFSPPTLISVRDIYPAPLSYLVKSANNNNNVVI